MRNSVVLGVLAALVALVSALPVLGQTDKPLKKAATSSEKKAAKKELQNLVINDALINSLPLDKLRPRCYHKVHVVPLEKGAVYTIDMASTVFDAFLRIEDSRGVMLAQDDDSGGNNNARIVFRPTATDRYRLIATTFSDFQTGPYTLMVRKGTGFPFLPGLGSGVAGFPGGGSAVYASGPEQIYDYGTLSLTVRVPQMPSPPHGYVEYRVLAKNKSSESHRLRLVIPQNNYSTPPNYLSAITREVEVGPAAEVSFSLFQPNLPLNGNGVQVVIDGRPQERTLPLGPQRGTQVVYSFGTTTYQPVVLLSLVMNNLQGQWFRGGHIPPSAGGGGIAFGNYQFSSLGQDGFRSKHWLGYSGYDGVVLRGAELTDKGPEVEAAVRQYVESGGALVVVGPWKAPETWNRTRQEVQDVTRFYPGFGQCLHVDKLDPGQWSNDQLRQVTTSWTETAEPWLHMRTPTDANLAFPVVEHLTIPVRGLFILMLVFSILIGPVNLYLLARMRRRIWMLWTVPAISLLTCVAVLGYMFVDEGWAAHVRTETFTILDENAHQASTLGWIGYYAPVVPSDGLHFSPQTELTPQLRPRTFRMDSRPHSLDWTEEQHLASGWLTARLPAHFLARKNERRLERVMVSKKDGVWTMVNGLKADIRQITFMGSGRGMGKGVPCKVYTAENVPAGQQAVLKVRDATAMATQSRLRELYRRDWLSEIRAARAEPDRYLRPGCYLAVLEANPFLEEGLRNPGHRKALALVCGIMKEPIQD
jgi:hypothetical protein